MSTLKLQILLGAVDKLTAPLKAVTGQSRNAREFRGHCVDKRILPAPGPDRMAALLRALEEGIGWGGVTAIFNRLTGLSLTPNGVHTMATRAGLRLVRYAVPGQSPEPSLAASMRLSTYRLANRVG